MAASAGAKKWKRGRQANMKPEIINQAAGLTDFQKKVLIAAAKIPKGKISTYKEIAKAAGAPKAYRAVGNALNKNPFAPEVPCHRVIKSDGRIGGFAGGTGKKARLLKKEGVILRNTKVKNFNRIFKIMPTI
jgi:methylated-DNA-[protein]-cysteine S-methyltransferase